MPDDRITLTCLYCGKTYIAWRGMSAHNCHSVGGLQRILEVCMEPPEDECTLLNEKSWYGVVCYRGKDTRAHRASWEIYNGQAIPPGLEVLHDCDVKNCFNPLHLTADTHQKNMQDAGRKGVMGVKDGSNKGEGHNQAKLTNAEVFAIRAEYTPGYGNGIALARKYNITLGNIMHIVKRKTWTHI